LPRVKKQKFYKNKFFHQYKANNLLHGRKGLSHLIVVESIQQINEFVILSILFLYIAGIGSGIEQENAVAQAAEGIARQPEATEKTQGTLLLFFAFMEGLSIYGFVIALFIFFCFYNF